MSVAHRILEKWNKKAIIIMQSHRIWGDVFIYFHREEWFTLHLRTDAFSSVTVKRDESSLLPPGVMELYSGLKGVTHRNPMRRMTEDEVRKIAHNCLDQVRSVDWNAKGRVDFVMAATYIRLTGESKGGLFPTALIQIFSTCSGSVPLSPFHDRGPLPVRLSVLQH